VQKIGTGLLLAVMAGASVAAPMTMTYSVGSPFEAFSYPALNCGSIHCEAPWFVVRTVLVPKFGLSGFRLHGVTVDFSLYEEDSAVVFNDKPFVEDTFVIASVGRLLWYVGPLTQDHEGGSLACNGAPDSNPERSCISEAELQPLQIFASTVASLTYSGSHHYDTKAALLAFSGVGDWSLTMQAQGNLSVINQPSILPTTARAGTMSSFIVTYEFCNFRTDENCSERIPEPQTAGLALIGLLALSLASRRRGHHGGPVRRHRHQQLQAPSTG
jgi:hypothetical protein